MAWRCGLDKPTAEGYVRPTKPRKVIVVPPQLRLTWTTPPWAKAERYREVEVAATLVAVRPVAASLTDNRWQVTKDRRVVGTVTDCTIEEACAWAERHVSIVEV